MNKTSLINKKLTYGGKSKVNWIEFAYETEQDKVILFVHYVFDQMTNEIEDLSFTLTKDELNTLIEELELQGVSQISKEDLTFEWRWKDEILEFRINGRNTSPFSGSFHYFLPDFVAIDNITKE